jgi:putative lysine transport system permease protein
MTLSKIIGIISDFWPMLLRGAWITLLISITGTILGFIIGLLVGVVRTIPIPDRGEKREIFKFTLLGKTITLKSAFNMKRALLKTVNAILSVYIEVFRGTPMIVQAMVIFYGTAMAFGIQMDRMFAGIFIVSINTGAYMSEIVRGGIISVDKGQFEAAQAIGMNHIQTMTNVVLPQAIRNILPATGNEFVINIKDTSVLNVISVTELYFQTSTVAGISYNTFGAFLVTSFIYLAMTFSVTRILRLIERKLDGPENYIMYANQMQVQTPEEMAEKNRSQMSVRGGGRQK